ncbi:hypothetical protein Acsp01_09280 [Actinoplanes sp. NBRC 101535]|nr:hypothetical protein Acsp01_09280 [Actinoplanes sp. NBRC 101535]
MSVSPPTPQGRHPKPSAARPTVPPPVTPRHAAARPEPGPAASYPAPYSAAARPARRPNATHAALHPAAAHSASPAGGVHQPARAGQTYAAGRTLQGSPGVHDGNPRPVPHAGDGAPGSATPAPGAPAQAATKIFDVPAGLRPVAGQENPASAPTAIFSRPAGLRPVAGLENPVSAPTAIFTAPADLRHSPGAGVSPETLRAQPGRPGTPGPHGSSSAATALLPVTPAFPAAAVAPAKPAVSPAPSGPGRASGTYGPAASPTVPPRVPDRPGTGPKPARPALDQTMRIDLPAGRQFTADPSSRPPVASPAGAASGPSATLVDIGRPGEAAGHPGGSDVLVLPGMAEVPGREGVTGARRETPSGGGGRLLSVAFAASGLIVALLAGWALLNSGTELSSPVVSEPTATSGPDARWREPGMPQPYDAGPQPTFTTPPYGG